MHVKQVYTAQVTGILIYSKHEKALQYYCTSNNIVLVHEGCLTICPREGILKNKTTFPLCRSQDASFPYPPTWKISSSEWGLSIFTCTHRTKKQYVFHSHLHERLYSKTKTLIYCPISCTMKSFMYKRIVNKLHCIRLCYMVNGW